jgi:DNA-binding Lrp family transcriptional regulator
MTFPLNQSHIKNSINKLQQEMLFAEIEQGLPLVSEPYFAIAQQISTPSDPVTEQQVINTIDAWQQQGLIRRFGLVVRHRKLGYNANAMVVWNIDSAKVDLIAQQLSQEPIVTLCYRRPRVLPHWPYNLFCMIHGKNREQVLAQLEDICKKYDLSHIDKNVLFSTIAYKQQGARYAVTSSHNNEQEN